MVTDPAPARPHTGRRRNEQARAAVLQATWELISNSDVTPVTIEAIAAAASVGKQTIYRWWPTKGAVVLGALTEHARMQVPAVDTGSLRTDLEAFLVASFLGARQPATKALLRAIMAEAQREQAVTDVLTGFTAARRDALRALLDRARDRGELPEHANTDLIVDLCFGLLWYRILVGHAPLTDTTARELTNAMLAVANQPANPQE